MKVLHVIAGAAYGGAESYSRDLILALADHGVDQVVVTRPHAAMVEPLRAAGVQIRPLRFSLLDRIGLGRQRIKALVARSQPDVAHLWMGRAASLLNRRLDIPTIGWFGGYYDLKRFRGVDVYVTVSRDISRHLIEAGAPADRVHTVHTFGALPIDPPIDRASLDTPEDATVILLPGRMHWKKGIDTMLEAMRELPETCVLWLAGDGPEMQAMRDLADRLGVTERVRFLGWRGDRYALMDAADIIAMPSRYEPFGTVMAEAWFMRKPLVVAAAQGPRQYVEDGVNALMVQPDDAAGLAGAVRKMIDSRALRDRLVEGGQRTFDELFTRERSVADMLAAYEHAIALHRTARQTAAE